MLNNLDKMLLSKQKKNLDKIIKTNPDVCLTKHLKTKLNAIANYMDYPPSYQHVHFHQSLMVKRQCGVKE